MRIRDGLRKEISGKTAWMPVYGLLFGGLALLVLGLIPLFGMMAFLFWPSLIVALLSIVPASLVACSKRLTFASYLLTALIAFGTLTLAGLFLRQQSAERGSHGVHEQATIHRQLQARLREPVLLDSRNEIRYDRALFESTGPWCRDPCIIVERIDWYRRIEWETPKEILEQLGVKTGAFQDARITVVIKIEDLANRTRIDIDVRESGNTTATLRAVVPSPKRELSSPVPRWLHFALEENPLVRALSPPRKYVEYAFIKRFLEASLSMEPERPRQLFELQARVISHRTFNPPKRIDDTDPSIIARGHQQNDPRCEGVLSIEQRPGISDYYVTFIHSDLPAPQMRFIDGISPVCTGNAVYRRIPNLPKGARRTRPDVIFERYDLSGRYTGDLYIPLPKESTGEHTWVAPASIIDVDGRIRFLISKMRHELATEPNGTPLLKSDGRMIQYAVLEGETEFEATLPDALGAPPSK